MGHRVPYLCCGARPAPLTFPRFPFIFQTGVRRGKRGVTSEQERWQSLTQWLREPGAFSKKSGFLAPVRNGVYEAAIPSSSSPGMGEEAS